MSRNPDVYAAMTRKRPKFLAASICRLTAGLFCFVLTLFTAVECFTQTAPQVLTSPTPETPLKTPAKQSAPKSFAAKSGLTRWFDLNTLSVATRYHFIKNANRTTAADNDQYQFIAKGKFKFDAAGRYSIFAGIQTGTSFTSGWENSGWGTGRHQTNIYVKQLYFEAKPVNRLSIQFGGIGINNGVNSEATGYDNDAYIMGERVTLKYPKQLYFDEISLTNAHLGDLTQPNVFRRFTRLNESNYHQFLFVKNLNKRISLSGDYTFESGMDTLRQAVLIKASETRLFDSILFENYERLDPNAGYGFNLQGDKKIGKRLTLTGGVIRIDRSILNGDKFPRGNRLHLTGVYNLSREFSITAWIVEGIGPIPGNIPRTRIDVILNYNILQTLRRAHIF
jgi:hypothetical protein